MSFFRNESYYSQFNNCDNIKNNFDYLTVPEAAILWCGISRSELAFELAQCIPKGTGNALSRNTMKHPYVQCVEPRCVLLHQAFDDGKLKMGRDGEKGDYINGEREGSNSMFGGMGHINPDRRTIKINDLKEFIVEYHADDMPKTLFSDIDIHKLKPITHDDYSALLAKNKALEARLEKAIDVYQEQKAEIATLKEQQKNEPDNGIKDSAYCLIAVLKDLLLNPDISAYHFKNDSENSSNKPSQTGLASYIDEMKIFGIKKDNINIMLQDANKKLKDIRKKS